MGYTRVHHHDISSREDSIKKRLRVFAQQHTVPCISSATESYLIQHLMTYKPVRILEIGTAIGLSSLVMAVCVRQRQGHITSFEISHPSYMAAIYHHHLAHITNTTLYHYNATTAPLNKLLHDTYDFIFIDGMKAEYASYLELVLPYTHTESTIICDDVIAYSDKVHPIYEVIEEHKLIAQQHLLEDNDGILLISK